MLRFWVLISIFCASLLYASSDKVLDQQQNYFLTATTPQAQPKVDPVTGEYSEEEVDLVVAGGEPLSARRFYNHLAPYDARYASWRYNPEAFFAANLEWHEQEMFAAIGDRDGSVFSLRRSGEDPYRFLSRCPSTTQIFRKTGSFTPSTHKSTTGGLETRKTSAASNIQALS